MWLQLVNERNLDVECNCVGVGRIGRKFIALNSPARSNHVLEEVFHVDGSDYVLTVFSFHELMGQ